MAGATVPGPRYTEESLSRALLHHRSCGRIISFHRGHLHSADGPSTLGWLIELRNEPTKGFWTDEEAFALCCGLAAAALAAGADPSPTAATTERAFVAQVEIAVLAETAHDAIETINEALRNSVLDWRYHGGLIPRQVPTAYVEGSAWTAVMDGDPVPLPPKSVAIYAGDDAGAEAPIERLDDEEPF